MYQKDLIRGAWKAAGLFDANDSKLTEFLKLLDDPTQCWAEMIDACRRNYTVYKAKLAQPIVATGDKLVRLALIRAALPSNADEMNLLQEYIASSDAVRDETELKAIALKNNSALNRALKKKVGLTAAVGAILATRATAT